MFSLQIFIYKTLFMCYLNINVVIFMVIFVNTVKELLLNCSFRLKLVYFYILLLLISLWGFFYSLESFIFIFLLGELTIILLFTLIYLTIQFFSIKKYNISLYYVVIVAILPSLYYLNITPTFIVNPVYYFLGKITSDDFFLFFFFFFYDYTLSVYLVGIILTIFSIFFILFYFSFKLLKEKKKNFYKKVYLLRKQNIIKQGYWRSNFFFFKNK